MEEEGEAGLQGDLWGPGVQEEEREEPGGREREEKEEAERPLKGEEAGELGEGRPQQGEVGEEEVGHQGEPLLGAGEEALPLVSPGWIQKVQGVLGEAHPQGREEAGEPLQTQGEGELFQSQGEVEQEVPLLFQGEVAPGEPLKLNHLCSHNPGRSCNPHPERWGCNPVLE